MVPDLILTFDCSLDLFGTAKVSYHNTQHNTRKQHNTTHKTHRNTTLVAPASQIFLGWPWFVLTALFFETGISHSDIPDPLIQYFGWAGSWPTKRFCRSAGASQQRCLGVLKGSPAIQTKDRLDRGPDFTTLKNWEMGPRVSKTVGWAGWHGHSQSQYFGVALRAASNFFWTSGLWFSWENKVYNPTQVTQHTTHNTQLKTAHITTQHSASLGLRQK